VGSVPSYNGPGLAMSQRSFLMLLLLLAAACGKDAEIKGPDGTLAVGAYAGLGWDDTCHLYALGGKVPAPPTCIPHVATEVIELDSSDPAVATVVAASDVPLEDAGTGYYVLGTGPGQATLTFKARFDDGSIRQSTKVIQVKVADTIKLRAICWHGAAVSDIVVPVGDVISFTVEIYAGTEQLVGTLPNPITGDGVMLEDPSFGHSPRPFVWSSTTARSVQLHSAYVSNIVGSLTAFTQDQVTDIGMQVYEESYRRAFTESDVSNGWSGFSVDTTLIVNGKATCYPLPLMFYSATPTVCSGIDGATDWATAVGYGGVEVHKEGICVLSASMDGQPIVAAQSFPVFLVSDGPGAQSTTSCSVEGQTMCQVGRSSVDRCKSSAWVADPPCPADQVCDSTAAGSVTCRGLNSTGP